MNNILEKDLYGIVKDFYSAQKDRIRKENRIRFNWREGMINLPQELENLEIIKIIEDWRKKEREAQKDKTKKVSFKRVVKKIKEIVLEELKEAKEQRKNFLHWNDYLKSLEVLESEMEETKKNKPFPKIMEAIMKPNADHWKEVDEKLYNRFFGTEEFLIKTIEEEVEKHPVWQDWLKYVKGIGLLLAGQIIGMVASGFKDEESIGHYRSRSQLNRYLGLGVENGKAARIQKGERATYNKVAKSLFLGRVKDSFGRARGQYYQLYLERKEYEVRKAESQGLEVVEGRKGKKLDEDKEITKGRIHNRAWRWVIKIFVSHLYEEWKKSVGLSVEAPWSMAVGGHDPEHYIPPIRDKVKK